MSAPDPVQQEPRYDPSKLEGRSSGAKVPSERLTVKIERYEVKGPPETHYVLARNVDDNSQVRIRLNTVAERLADFPKLDADKVARIYADGEEAGQRQSLASKSRAGEKGAPITHISFDDARKVGTGPDGIAEYRAHWANTLSKHANPELRRGLGSIVLSGAQGGSAQKGYVEFVEPAVKLDASNVKSALASALANTDAQGFPKNSFAVLRVIHATGEKADQVVVAPRLYAAAETHPETDDYGRETIVRTVLPPETTLGAVLGAEPKKEDMGWKNAQNDTFRAVVAALSNEPLPKFASHQPQDQDKFKTIYAGIKSGDLKVDLIAGDTMQLGKKTTQSYLKSKNGGYGALHAYDVKEPANATDPNLVKIKPGFLDTRVAFHRHPDNNAYVVYASPVKQFPDKNGKDAVLLRDLKLADPAPKAAPAKTVEHEQAAAAGQAADPAPAHDSVPAPETPAAADETLEGTPEHEGALNEMFEQELSVPPKSRFEGDPAVNF